MPRTYTMTLRCAEPGCRETSLCETESRREEAEAYARYAKYPYRCFRHIKPDEVLSVDNPATEAALTVHQTYRTNYRGETAPAGIYWGVTPDKASNGILYGPGFRAIAKDFPPGTRLIVTARLEFPDSASVAASDTTEGTTP